MDWSQLVWELPSKTRYSRKYIWKEEDVSSYWMTLRKGKNTGK
jgi:hypothetical protein